MKHNNIVSIIIPCYNNGRYLVKMIECFRRQTSSDWELIIVDDGSTDNTPNKVEDAIRDLPNAHLFCRNRMPKGSVVCRNIGFEHAKGKYVCHLDADDLVSDTFVEHRVAYMEAHPYVDYASFPAKVFTNDNELPQYDSPGAIWGEPRGNKDLLYYFLCYQYPFSVWNNIYKKEAINDLPWDENVLIKTDFSFIVPGILKGLKHEFSGLKEIDYYYRHETTNKVAMTANQVSPEKCQSTIYLFSKTLDSLKVHGLYQKYKNVFFEYILIYFQELVFKNTGITGINNYLIMCSKYYSGWKILKMEIMVGVFFAIKSHKMQIATYLILGFVLFGKKEFLRKLRIYTNI